MFYVQEIALLVFAKVARRLVHVSADTFLVRRNSEGLTPVRVSKGLEVEERRLKPGT